MVEYGKLENGILKYAENPVTQNVSKWKELGYKLVVKDQMPELLENQTVQPSYVELVDIIIESYTVVNVLGNE